ncbi:MAG: hypothetical protein LBP36_00135 [Oscillospiraceae bacterium]|jgi:hypothetical protein|nr:hypothetical protein [Oscillospiraceae bacterium]
MKKFLKYFSLMLLFFTIVINCLAVNDCRYVRNQAIIDAIKKQLNYRSIIKAYGSDEELCADYENIIFMIDSENISKVIAAIPVAKKSKNKKIIGEIITPIMVKNAKTLNDVFRCFMENSSNCSDIKLYKYLPIFFNPNTYVNRYLNIQYLFNLLKPFVTLKEDDQIFYVILPNGSSENLHIVYKTNTGESILQKSFIFQNPSVIEVPNLNLNIIESLDMEEPASFSLFDSIKKFFGFSSDSKTRKDATYAKLKTD